nr:hypothetical protein [Burkholderia pyrrocinia]
MTKKDSSSRYPSALRLMTLMVLLTPSRCRYCAAGGRADVERPFLRDHLVFRIGHVMDPRARKTG